MSTDVIPPLSWMPAELSVNVSRTILHNDSSRRARRKPLRSDHGGSHWSIAEASRTLRSGRRRAPRGDLPVGADEQLGYAETVSGGSIGLLPWWVRPCSGAHWRWMQPKWRSLRDLSGSVPPAGDGAVGPHLAGVLLSGGHGSVRARTGRTVVAAVAAAPHCSNVKAEAATRYAQWVGVSSRRGSC